MKRILWFVGIILLCTLTLTLCACNKDTPAEERPAVESPAEESPAKERPAEESPAEESPAEDTPAQTSLLQFSGVSFADRAIEYDGEVHTLTADGIPEGATATYSQNSGTDVADYRATATITKEGYQPLTLHATLSITVPTAQSVVTARSRANEADEVGYDFHLNLAGTLSIAGYSGTANANYDGKYRYNRTTDTVKFSRTTSGLLLYDATEYIQYVGDTKVVVKANDKGTIKKIGLLNADDEDLLLVNKPIAALVDALGADELQNIALAEANSDCMFKADIRLTADNALIRKVLNVIAKQGTSISLKEVGFTNPVSGLVLYFNMSKGRMLNDFALSAEVSIPTSGANTTLTLNYSQVGTQSAIITPTLGSVLFDKADITRELAAISQAIANLKQSADYSLDVEAKNKLDPGWTSAAISDRYTARMYKHTYQKDGDDFVAFNHSYEYKTHHEEDGAETYKYTIGNIQDNSVYLISRKGSNTNTALGGVTADTRFDWLTDAFTYTADDVDCIRKTVSGGTTTYSIYLNNAYTVSVNQIVADMINSNDAEGVVAVNNYFAPDNYTVGNADMVVCIGNGVISSIDIETEVKYTPIAGDYSSKRVTLTDSISMEVNAQLAKAREYQAPKSVTTPLTGLNNSKFYIL